MKRVGDEWRMIGLMSGTSADGVDAALVTVREGGDDGVSVRREAFLSVPYEDELRARILAASVPGEATVEDICVLNFVLGEAFASAAESVASAANVPLGDVDLIGSHGQTIYHLPERRRIGTVGVSGSTLQIGEPSVIAERTGVTTVADFRARDMAAGGQGAPLVSRIDEWMFAVPDRTRVLLNIGGIANMTVLPPKGAGSDPGEGGGRGDATGDGRVDAASETELVAFDTGPGNMVIDGLVGLFTQGAERFDRDGRRAASGRVDEQLLNDWMDDPYVQAPAPKTTGRERYGAQFAARAAAEARRRGLSEDDVIATATAFTAESVAHHVRAYVSSGPRPDAELIVAGGGGDNPTLMRMLKERAEQIPGVRVRRSDEAVGWDGGSKEAIAFALLAYLTYVGRPGNVPAATGARRPVVLGKIVPSGRS